MYNCVLELLCSLQAWMQGKIDLEVGINLHTSWSQIEFACSTWISNKDFSPRRRIKKTNQSDAIKVRPKEVYNLYNTFMQGFEVSEIIFCLGGQIIPHMEINNKYKNLPLHWIGWTLVQPLHPRHLEWVCTSAPCALSAPDNNLFPIIIRVKFAAKRSTRPTMVDRRLSTQRQKNTQKTETRPKNKRKTNWKTKEKQKTKQKQKKHWKTRTPMHRNTSL